jgi:opacity protein-like surface antigen
MSFACRAARSAALILLATLVPGAAQAQEPRIFASFVPALAAVSGDTELGLGGTAGYRFSEDLWFEGDVTWIDAAAREHNYRRGGYRPAMAGMRHSYRFGPGLPGFPGMPGLPELPELPEIRTSADGYTFIATMGVRYEFPVQTARFRPYVSGGIGINNTDQEIRIEATPLTPVLVDSLSHTGYAVSGGAGASIQLHRALWATVDAKYFRLSNGRNVMRFGGGVTVRF